MPEIAGKSVTFRDMLPAAEWWELYSTVVKIKKGDLLLEKLDYPTGLKIAQASIKSWEFEGDPSDPEAYKAIGFMDMVELVRLAFNHAISLINEEGESLGE